MMGDCLGLIAIAIVAVILANQVLRVARGDGTLTESIERWTLAFAALFGLAALLLLLAGIWQPWWLQ